MAFAGIDASEEREELEDYDPFSDYRSPNAHLNERGVREVVRRVIEEDQSLKEVGDWIGLSRPAIGAILRGDHYADLNIPLRSKWPEVRRRRWRENGRKGGRPKKND